MNFALSPETAVTVGSASVWATPCRSKACKLALKLWFPFTQFRIPWVALMPSCLMISRRISATVTCKLTWSAPRIVKALITLPRALLEDLPADPPPPPGAPPEPFEMEIEAPGAPEAGVSLTKPSAMSSAFWASSADATDPVRMIVFSTVRT
jgi:hypothetical protein